MMQPTPLESGDTIAIVAPASMGKKEEVDVCMEALEIKGFRVKLASNVYDRWGSFAGSDTDRAQGIMQAFKDEEVKAIWALRGGYGSGRLLDQLDYEIIRSNPKIFIGMSDITALHMAFNQNANLVTYLGPNASFLFAVPKEKNRFLAEEHAWRMLKGSQDTLVVQGSKTIVSGKSKGILTGGNLALIAAHLGTPWQIQTKGKILLLEDVQEYTYRIDRFLCQLKQAGLLDAVSGVILSSWSDCKPRHIFDFKLIETFEIFFQKAPYPVLLGFPSGHIENQVTLPLGKECELDTNYKTLTVF